VGETYVIVGAGAAGLAAVRAIRRRDGSGRIVVLTAESGPSYSPALLPYLIARKIDEKALNLADSRLFAGLGVDHRGGVRAMGIDVDARMVLTADGGAVPFTRLLVATGASARGESVAGTATEEAPLTLRTLADARLLHRRLLTARRVTVLGAGLAGLEIAMAARILGRDVTVVAASPHVLSRNATSADARVVQGWFEEAGIGFLLGRRIVGWEGHAEQTWLHTAEGDRLPTDVLVAAKGAAPNTAWASSPLTGMHVDEGMRTSIPDVFAAGDAAVGRHALTGRAEPITSWPSACAEGEVAGSNMAGADVRMPGEVPFNVLPAFQRRVAFIGCTTDAALRSLGGDVRVAETGMPSQGSGARLWHRDERIVGAVLFGAHPGVGNLRRVIETGTTVPLRRGRPAWPTGPLVALHSGQHGERNGIG
jgi:NADPH-dependent 2,4-dienoyl-CoA reductase/sulfur reductase-like enzyme